MKCVHTALVAFLESFIVGAASFVLIVIPAILVALFSFDGAFDIAFVSVISAAIWLWGHAVSLSFEISAEQAATLGGVANAVAIPVSLPLLGVAALTSVGAFRAGARAAAAIGQKALMLVAFGGSLLGFALVSVLLAGLGQSLTVQPFYLLMLKPLLFFIGFFAIGAGFTRRQQLASVFESAAKRVSANPLWHAFIATTVVFPRTIAMLFSAYAALAAAGLLATIVLHFTDYLRLSQSLQLDWLGTVTFFMLHLLLIPVLLIWVFAWFTGTGFYFGENILFSPFAAGQAAFPTLPLLGLLPNQWGRWGFTAPLVIILIAFAVGFLAHRAAKSFDYKQKLMLTGAVFLTAFVATAGLGGLAIGAVGPGWLEVTGPRAWLMAFVASLEMSCGFLAGIFALDVAGLRAADIRELVARLSRRSADCNSKVSGDSAASGDIFASDPKISSAPNFLVAADSDSAADTRAGKTPDFIYKYDSGDPYEEFEIGYLQDTDSARSADPPADSLDADERNSSGA